MARFGLSSLLSKIDLSKDASEVRKPVYDELFSSGCGNLATGQKHKEAFIKMIKWPSYHSGKSSQSVSTASITLPITLLYLLPLITLV